MTEILPPGLLKEEHLKAWTGFKRRTDLETRLRELKIPYAYGQGGAIITTQAAVDGALLGRSGGATMNFDTIDFE